MKGLIVIAIILAIIGVGFLVATLFTSGGNLVFMSIGAGLALVAFILTLVGYVNKAAK